MADDRAQIRALIAERDALEQRISLSSERLRSRGVDEHTRLVDNEARVLTSCQPQHMLAKAEEMPEECVKPQTLPRCDGF